MKRNIWLVYFLVGLRYCWFWLGVWVFFYLRFTNYAGIGLVETAMILTVTLMEIPTGAIADLFGKRLTLVFSYLIRAVGDLVMAFAPNINFLIISASVGSVGTTLYSGTMEALIYDTLKENGQEQQYSKILSNGFSIQMVAMAATSIVGGFLYFVDPRLPFIVSAVFSVIGFFAAFFLIEPKIDTIKFSLTNFIAQNSFGLKQLFRTSDFVKQTFFLLTIGMVIEIADEVLNDVLAVEFGFNAKDLGIFFAVVALFAAVSSQFSPWLRKRFGGLPAVTVLGVILALTFVFSPLVGFATGAILLFIRAGTQTIYQNFASTAINNITESKYRATTLSSFNMLKNLPYLLTAILLGTIMDAITARGFAFVLGAAMLTLLLAQVLLLKPKINTTSTDDAVEPPTV